MIWIQAYYLAKIYQESSLPLQETGKVGKDCSVRAVGQKERDLGKAIIIELKIVFRYATIQPQPSNAIRYHVFITANEYIPIKRFHANPEYFILRLFAQLSRVSISSTYIRDSYMYKRFALLDNSGLG